MSNKIVDLSSIEVSKPPRDSNELIERIGIENVYMLFNETDWQQQGGARVVTVSDLLDRAQVEGLKPEETDRFLANRFSVLVMAIENGIVATTGQGNDLQFVIPEAVYDAVCDAAVDKLQAMFEGHLQEAIKRVPGNLDQQLEQASQWMTDAGRISGETIDGNLAKAQSFSGYSQAVSQIVETAQTIHPNTVEIKYGRSRNAFSPRGLLVHASAMGLQGSEGAISQWNSIASNPATGMTPIEPPQKTIVSKKTFPIRFDGFSSVSLGKDTNMSGRSIPVEKARQITGIMNAFQIPATIETSQGGVSAYVNIPKAFLMTQFGQARVQQAHNAIARGLGDGSPDLEETLQQLANGLAEHSLAQGAHHDNLPALPVGSSDQRVDEISEIICSELDKWQDLTPLGQLAKTISTIIRGSTSLRNSDGLEDSFQASLREVLPSLPEVTEVRNSDILMIAMKAIKLSHEIKGQNWDVPEQIKEGITSGKLSARKNHILDRALEKDVFSPMITVLELDIDASKLSGMTASDFLTEGRA